MPPVWGWFKATRLSWREDVTLKNGGKKFWFSYQWQLSATVTMSFQIPCKLRACMFLCVYTSKFWTVCFILYILIFRTKIPKKQQFCENQLKYISFVAVSLSFHSISLQKADHSAFQHKNDRKRHSPFLWLPVFFPLCLLWSDMQLEAKWTVEKRRYVCMNEVHGPERQMFAKCTENKQQVPHLVEWCCWRGRSDCQAARQQIDQRDSRCFSVSFRRLYTHSER